MKKEPMCEPSVGISPDKSKERPDLEDIAAGISMPIPQERTYLHYDYDEELNQDISELTRGLVIVAGAGALAVLGYRHLIRSRRGSPE